jgi:hypothetical protein
MKPLAHFTAMLTGLVLLLNITPSWGQTPVCVAPGCNPTLSDGFTGNTAGGTQALPNGGGIGNTAFGSQTLVDTTGGLNTAIGASALASNTTGDNNTAIGAAALRDSTGGNNTAIGVLALQFNSGNNNTATGEEALSGNDSGGDNTATGFQTLFFSFTGEKNTALGSKALFNSTGNKNIAIGFNAGSNLRSGHNNIYLGSEGGDTTESQTMRLGKAQTRTFISGITGVNVNGATVEIDTTTGQLGVKTSSARYKRDIEAMANRSEGLLKLRPVTFVYKDDASAAPRYGLIAEEVATVYPELVTRTATGEVQTVKYQDLIPMLLNELQHEHQARQQESARVAALEAQLAALQALVSARLGQTGAQDGPGDSIR